MSKETNQMHLGAFLFNVGHHVAAWRLPETEPERIMDAELYLQCAQIAERGKFDMLFLADTLAVFDRNGTQLKHNVAIRPEPITLLSYLSGVTSHIGLTATVSTTYHDPYNLAREFATLDHLSGGRAAWNVVTSSRNEEAANFSKDDHPEHNNRYERAREFVEAASKLWDSWEDDAIIGDREAGLFADSDKVHEIHHKGEFFAVKGPLNLPRSPQGRPVIIQAGSSETGKRLAAETAEVIFTAWQTLEEAQQFYRSVKSQLADFGRSEDSLKIMPGILPIIGSTEEEAKRKEAEIQELVLPEIGLAMLAGSLNVDLSGYPLDGPLPELPELTQINGNKSRFQLVADMARREGLTIRQLMYRVTGARGHRTYAGTPEQIADQLEEWFTNGAADGFNIMAPFLPGGLELFVEHVVPILQRRGLYRTEYTGSTLRDHLGLARPISRYSVSASI
ncbi:LLM class flavin-dependent oxidoreductase [Paenibacillus kobensis]|uniref:LLM class flavin-dependent oxidoreductase n=1 Tax=Paenibacillus kobensis TaxID=59841 RepID=UPI000FD756F8|nr:LLM class flavin-dependent oxidoreductase [Paenibacillus kobensis]